MSVRGWYGVDLDGTLAHYTTWSGPCEIGEPIKVMQDRVIGWLLDGRDVRIVTARAYNGDGAAIPSVVAAIERWCIAHLGQPLKVTNAKDFLMISLYDDRCVTVELNTGRILTVKPGAPAAQPESTAAQLREWANHVLDGSAVYCQAPVALLEATANGFEAMVAQIDVLAGEIKRLSKGGQDGRDAGPEAPQTTPVGVAATA